MDPENSSTKKIMKTERMKRKRNRQSSYHQVTRKADGTFNDTTSLLHSSHAYLKLINVVQGIEDAKDVNTVLFRLFTEVVYGIIR